MVWPYYHSLLVLVFTFMAAIYTLKLSLFDWTIYQLKKLQWKFKEITSAKRRSSVESFVFTSMLKSKRNINSNFKRKYKFKTHLFFSLFLLTADVFSAHNFFGMLISVVVESTILFQINVVKHIYKFFFIFTNSCTFIFSS